MFDNEQTIARFERGMWKMAGKMNLYRTIETDECTFVDKDIVLNRPYSYRVKVSFENGKSTMSEKATIGM